MREKTFAVLIRALSGALAALVLLFGGGGGWVGAALGQETTSVDLKVLQWGVGNMARPGGWVGVQVQVTDLGQTTREVLLELSVPDPDGDATLYQTTLAVGGERKTTWIYGRLPFSAFTAQEFVMSAYAVTEPTSAQRTAGVAREGELLGRTKFRIPTQTEPRVGQFGVIGRPKAGLTNFKTDASGYGSGYPPMAHEKADLVDMSVSTLPDRWMGLSAMETIVWTGNGPDFEPSELSEDSAAAIREWVARGGHLIVVLPVVGQTWTDPRQPLAEIFPRVSVQRLESVDLNPYRPLLTDNKDVALPTSGIVQVLEPLPDAKPGEATRILVGPDGKAVVTSRTVGSGAVTVVGLDVASRALDGLNAVKADVFWNRVMGRRGRLLSMDEMQKAQSDRTYRGPRNFSNREQRLLDHDIAGLINKTGKAFAGVMLAFVLFACYWVVAGPLGFWVAKRRESHKHSWVGFVAVGSIFTVVAWTGATWLKPGEGDAQHLTIVDHVYGQPQQRAKVWMSVLLPRFGMMEVAIGNPVEGGAGADAKNPVHDTLAPWDPAPNELAGAASSQFADSQGYGVNSRSPSRMLTPARSTTKNYVGEWLGGPTWKMPLAYGEDGTTPGALTLVPDSSQRGWRVDGTLKHELPGTLKDVTVVVIRGQRPVKAAESYVGQLQTEGDCYDAKDWKVGDTLDVDSETQPWRSLYRPGGGSSLLRDIVGNVANDDYYGGRINRSTGGLQTGPQVHPESIKNRMLALAFYGVLEPPNAAIDDRQALVQRTDGHRYSLSRWFSRPCVIVIGQMENAPSPVPLALNGDPMGTIGRTVVRWIYPLPDNPPPIVGSEPPTSGPPSK